MRIVFFGTPPFAAHVLKALIERSAEVVAVVTRPDRPKGRSQKMQASAVKTLQQQQYPHLPLFCPEKASTPQFESVLRALNPDVFVVVAYGEIIKQHLLDLPRIMPINIHASILPKYRGAAPIQRAIMDGEVETGVTIMEMVLEMDAGSILQIAKVPIDKSATFEEVESALRCVAPEALIEVLRRLEQGVLKKCPQDSSAATFAAKISLEDRIIDWKRPAQKVHDQVRGLSPSPGAFTLINLGGATRRLGIKRTLIDPNLCGPAGKTLALSRDEWVVACGQGALRLLEVQLEGKKTLDIKSFLRGLGSSVSIKVD